MKPTPSNKQLSWANKNHTWYVRGDSITRKALAIAAKYEMNTDETMLLVQAMIRTDVTESTLSIMQTKHLDSFEAVVNRTLDILFDPKALNMTDSYAPAFAAIRKLITPLYLSAINPQRLEAITDGSYRLSGQKDEDA